MLCTIYITFAAGLFLSDALPKGKSSLPFCIQNTLPAVSATGETDVVLVELG